MFWKCKESEGKIYHFTIKFKILGYASVEPEISC